MTILEQYQKEVEQSRLQGIQQGMQQGIQVGHLQVAKKLLLRGVDVNLIAEATGLSVEEINELQTQMEGEKRHLI